MPSTLPDEDAIRWEAYLPSSGIGGIAATKDLVVVGSRDATDKFDLFQGFDAQTGELRWQHRTLALGQLDYGNTPRATPLIIGPLVYTLGAFGDLSCLDIEAGIPLWQKNLSRDFGGTQPQWGFSGSPLAIGENLLLQPGGENAVVLLDGVTGEILKSAAGGTTAYASLAFESIGESTQVVSLEEKDVVGWDLDSGKELWRHRPASPGDFGVPSPVIRGSDLYLTSEGNGTRRLKFSPDGIVTGPVAVNKLVSPDSHSPVLVDDLLIVAHNGLRALDSQDLESRWTIKDRALVGYCSLLSTDSKLLATTENGELILVEFDKNSARISDRFPLSPNKVKTLSHPALVGTHLYVQIGQKLVCIDLEEENQEAAQ